MTYQYSISSIAAPSRDRRDIQQSALKVSMCRMMEIRRQRPAHRFRSISSQRNRRHPCSRKKSTAWSIFLPSSWRKTDSCTRPMLSIRRSCIHFARCCNARFARYTRPPSLASRAGMSFVCLAAWKTDLDVLLVMHKHSSRPRETIRFKQCNFISSFYLAGLSNFYHKQIFPSLCIDLSVINTKALKQSVPGLFSRTAQESGLFCVVATSLFRYKHFSVFSVPYKSVSTMSEEFRCTDGVSRVIFWASKSCF